MVQTSQVQGHIQTEERRNPAWRASNWIKGRRTRQIQSGRQPTFHGASVSGLWYLPVSNILRHGAREWFKEWFKEQSKMTGRTAPACRQRMGKAASRIPLSPICMSQCSELAHHTYEEYQGRAKQLLASSVEVWVNMRSKERSDAGNGPS